MSSFINFAKIMRLYSSKREEYISVGVKLGLLINSQQQQVKIDRSKTEVEIKNLPTKLSGETILPEFILNLPCY